LTFNGTGVYSNTAATLTNTYIQYVVASPASFTLNSNLTTAASRTFTINSGASLTLGTGTLASQPTGGGLITNSGTLMCGTNVITGTSFTLTNSGNANQQW